MRKLILLLFITASCLQSSDKKLEICKDVYIDFINAHDSSALTSYMEGEIFLLNEDMNPIRHFNCGPICAGIEIDSIPKGKYWIIFPNIYREYIYQYIPITHSEEIVAVDVTFSRCTYEDTQNLLSDHIGEDTLSIYGLDRNSFEKSYRLMSIWKNKNNTYSVRTKIRHRPYEGEDLPDTVITLQNLDEIKQLECNLRKISKIDGGCDSFIYYFLELRDSVVTYKENTCHTWDGALHLMDKWEKGLQVSK